MTVALVASSASTGVWNAASTSSSVGPGANTTIGNLGLRIVCLASAPTNPSCSDNSSQAGTANTWHRVGSGFTNTTAHIEVFWTIYTRSVLTTDAVAVTWTGSIVRQGNLSEWSGTDGNGPVDTSGSGNTGTGTSQATGATGTATAGDLVVGAFCYGAAQAYTVGADGRGNTMTSLHAPTAAQSRSSLVEYLVESVAQTYTPAATTASGSSNYAAVAVRFAKLPAAPVNTVAPVISGTKRMGQTLSSTTGTFTGDVSSGYAYQWKRAGVSISGATSSTYTLVNLDVGSAVAITCAVTATGTGGSTAATSNTLTGIAGNYTWAGENPPLIVCAADPTSYYTAPPASASGSTGNPHGAGEQADWPQLQHLLLLT